MKNKMKKVSIGIEGMSCNGCVNKVEESLKMLPGVKKVKVSLKDKNATLKIPEETSIDEVKSRIKDAGYNPGDIL